MEWIDWKGMIALMEGVGKLDDTRGARPYAMVCVRSLAAPYCPGGDRI